MYRGIDALVGEARELMGEEGVVAVVSDHGFGPHARTFVRTDRLLADADLFAGGVAGRGEHVTRALRRAPALRRTLRRARWVACPPASATGGGPATGVSRVDWTRSQAYRIPLYPPAEGIVVNLRGRQEQGAVESGVEYEQVRERVIAALEGLRDP